jgi:hypothetical protein
MYRSNNNAWMTATLFQEWLVQFNKAMKKMNRHVILLLDNATSHQAPTQLSNVRIHFLPPNMTSHIQPLDAGIINSFKCHYRKLQIQKMLDLVERSLPAELSLDQAIRFSRMAWDSVTTSTIVNCWHHVGIRVKSPAPNEELCVGTNLNLCCFNSCGI